jgi:hypothetical protein
MAFLGLFKTRPKEEEEARTFLLRFLNERCFQDKVLAEEKRWENRSSLMMGAWVIPLIDGEPVLSRAYPTITKDFTTSGLSIVVDGPPSCAEVIIALPVAVEAVLLRCKVLHSRLIGAGFLVAGLRVLGLVPGNQYPELSKLALQ